MFRSALLILAALASVAPALPAAATTVPGEPTAETEIADVLGRWDRARAQRDRRVLAELMAEDFTATRNGGARLTRADILAGKSPEAGARLIYREDIAFAVAGDRATVTSRVIRIGTARGPDLADVSRETAELRRSDGRWRLAGTRSIPARPATGRRRLAPTA